MPRQANASKQHVESSRGRGERWRIEAPLIPRCALAAAGTPAQTFMGNGGKVEAVNDSHLKQGETEAPWPGQGPWNVDLQTPPGPEGSNGSLLRIRRGHPGIFRFRIWISDLRFFPVPPYTASIVNRKS